MMLFDRRRTSAPAFLRGGEARAARVDFLSWLGLAPDVRAQTPSPAGRLSLARPDVEETLTGLFQGKCAFCETIGRAAPHRFRPPTEASPVQDRSTSHLHYGWLAEAWENVLPVCDACRPRDPTRFPVRGPRATAPDQRTVSAYVDREDGLWALPVEEEPLLLDPCGERDPAAHLQFRMDGAVVGHTMSGDETIRQFRLARRDLRLRRRGAFQAYSSDLLRDIAEPEADFAMLSFEALEFGGAWSNLLRQFLAPIGGDLASPEALRDFVVGMRETTDARSRLLQLIREVQAAQRAAREIHGAEGRRAASHARRERRTSADERVLVSFRVHRFKGVEELFVRMPRSVPPAAVDGESDGWRPQTPALLVLGENAVGKSSVLEGLALGFSERVMIDDLTRRFEVEPRSLVMDPAQVGDGPRRLVREAVIELNFDDGDTRIVTVGKDGIETFGREDLPPVFAYGAFRQFLGGQGEWTRASPIATLFRTDHLLPDPEAWLVGLRRDRFDLVIRALHDILSYHGPFDVVQKRGGRVFVVTSEPGPDGEEVVRRTPLSVVSSGFRSVLAMVCDVMRGLMDDEAFDSFTNARAIVLIDEVEAHLHPRWKIRIMRGLRKALPQVTFIATTHDPLCLRGMEKGEVVALRRGADPTVSQLGLSAYVEALTDLPSLDYLTVEQLLTSDLFSLYSTDRPIAEFNFARIGTLLGQATGPHEDRKGRDDQADRRPTAEEAHAIDWFRREIAEALPIGSSEVQRLVGEAVAAYLRDRRLVRAERLKDLRQGTRERIVEALKRVAG